MTLDSLTERDLDALRELANIGCGHAAGALSRLVGGRKIGIDIPRCEAASLDEVAALAGGPSTEVAAVCSDVEGGLRGLLLLLLPLADARALAGLLTGREPAEDLTEMGRSAVCEAGNIIGGACLTALATALSVRLLPSVPRYRQGPATEVLGELSGLAALGRALVMETRFEALDGARLAGHFLILPDLPSLPEMLKALAVARGR